MLMLIYVLGRKRTNLKLPFTFLVTLPRINYPSVYLYMCFFEKFLTVVFINKYIKMTILLFDLKVTEIMMRPKLI